MFGDAKGKTAVACKGTLAAGNGTWPGLYPGGPGRRSGPYLSQLSLLRHQGALLESPNNGARLARAAIADYASPGFLITG